MAELPILNASAYHGIAGEFVENVVRRSEAPGPSLLFHFLAAVGNIIGHRAYYPVGAAKHYGNLYVGIVGPTSEGRKGHAKSETEYAVKDIDPFWDFNGGGLSTGEGIIGAVCDDVDEDGIALHPDKRCCIYESELGRALIKSAQPGNTLSPVLRDAYDGGKLLIKTRTNPLVATGAHISVIGHITPEELRLRLPKTDFTNGFANRFFWCHSRRNKKFSRPVPPDPAEHGYVVNIVRAALAQLPNHQATSKAIPWHDAAGVLWDEFYYGIVERSGIIGRIVTRTEAKVPRVALIYAVLDGSHKIRREHLNAALAIADYSEKSAELIFGDSTGDKIADKIRDALRSSRAGLTRTDMFNDVLKKNVSAEKIAVALGVLLDEKMAHFKNVQTHGRPAERWFSGCLMPTTGAPQRPALVP